MTPASRPLPLWIPATKQFLLMSQLKELGWEEGRKREREEGGNRESEWLQPLDHPLNQNRSLFPPLCLSYLVIGGSGGREEILCTWLVSIITAFGQS